MSQISRQEKRRMLWRRVVEAVNSSNLHPVVDRFNRCTGQYRAMLRRERRRLAKAYFAGAWEKEKLLGQGRKG